jgi:predicted deacylase
MRRNNGLERQSMIELPEFHSGHMRVQQGFCHPVEGLELPFGLLEGPVPGPCLLVTAGVHGSEFCSIEVALRLLKLDPRQIRGTLLVLPILNVEGFKARSIYVMPQDGRNLNRMFPGRPDGTVSERLAHWLVTSVYPKVDAYLDLHGGDLSESLNPFSLFPRGSEASKLLASVFGLPIAVAAGGEGYTINAAGKLGVPSVLAEVGGNGMWNEAGVTQMMDGIARVMRHLGMTSGNVAPPPQPEPEFVTMWVPSAPTDGLWYPAKDLAGRVETGEVVGEIRSIFGEVLASVRSEKTGSILYRLASLSVNKGEALLGVGTPLSGS